MIAEERERERVLNNSVTEPVCTLKTLSFALSSADSAVTVVLHYCDTDVTVVLHYCYSDVTLLLDCCNTA